MSRFAFTTLLAVVLPWLSASCAVNKTTSMTIPWTAVAHTTPVNAPALAAAQLMPGAPTLPTPATPASAISLASGSPWNGASIFFFPLTLIVLTFGAAMYLSSIGMDT
jgi:hypothetical protein